MTELHYNVELFVVRDRILFGFGWAFLDDQAIRSMRLELSLVDGQAWLLPVNHGAQREDVAGASPENKHAEASGFVFYGAWQGENLRLAKLVVEGAAGLVERRELPYTLQAGHGCLDPTNDARQYLRGKVTLDALAGRISSSNDSPPVLVIDHALGGGANIYRKELVEKFRTEHRSVLLLTYDLPSLQYSLELLEEASTAGSRYLVQDLRAVWDLIRKGYVKEIFYNNAVSFPEPAFTPEWLVMIRRHYGVRLVVALHDFFAVCPSYYLLNDQGEYCGVPSREVCRRCLPNNQNEFVSLFVSRDIDLWRRRWGEFLHSADEIICFSNSSKAIFRRAYGDLREEKLVVRPHRVDYLGDDIPAVDFQKPLHIGVQDQLGMHKGAEVISAVADVIAKRGLDISISVIGTLETDYDADIVDVTGPYDRRDLSSLIESCGANMFIFPSIWPETFSYVTEELIRLKLPVICFDFGAQGERVSQYSRGRVVKWSGDANRLLDETIGFFEELRAATAEGDAHESSTRLL